jgi:hypothetical protein
MADLEDLKRIAEVEFADIVRTSMRIDYKMRIILIDNSFIDVFLSERLPNKFGFHWECMDKSGTIYRYDNVPDKKWQNLTSFPCHFHSGSQNSVVDSPFPQTPIDGFRGFMEFVRGKVR